MFDELDARARRGDAAAACRLGAELERCRMLRWRKPNKSELTASLARQNLGAEETARLAESFLRRADEYRLVERVCAGDSAY